MICNDEPARVVPAHPRPDETVSMAFAGSAQASAHYGDDKRSVVAIQLLYDYNDLPFRLALRGFGNLLLQPAHGRHRRHHRQHRAADDPA
jgi:hypothetical protein